MNLPALFISDNLIWTTTGHVWALYRLRPVNYTYKSDKAKLQLLQEIKGAMMNFPQEAMILSVCREIDPVAVAERMLDDVDMQKHSAWRDQVVSTLNKLENGPPLYDRYFYLAIELPERNWLQASAAFFQSKFGLTPPPPTRNERQLRTSQAKQFETQIATGLSMRPAATAEIRWIYDRSIFRGIVEPDMAEQWSTSSLNGRDPVDDLPYVETINRFDAVIYEGGEKHDEGRPKLPRYLKIETEIGASYQTSLVIAGMPSTWRFPGGGGEWWIAADHAPFPIDWCARITSVANATAQLRSRRQARQLIAQVDEYVGEPSGPPADLESAMEAINSQRAELAASPTTPELKCSMIFSLASHDLQDLEQQAGVVRAMFEAWEYNMPRPTGGQTDLFLASLPGSDTPAVAKDYAQYFMPGDLASGMPIAGTRIGDPTGFYLGHTLDSGTHQPVLFDGQYGPANDRSGCVAVVGTLGSGKSYAIKSMAYGELSKGSQVVLLDRTTKGEYVKFSEAVPGTSQIVRLDPNSQICVDPLAVFSGANRALYATGFLTLLTGTPPTDPQGAILAEAVNHIAARPDGRLADVVDELDKSEETEAKELARKIRVFAQTSLAHVAFGRGEAVQIDADFIVMWMPGLQLPEQEQLVNEYLAKQLLPEEIFSQALLYLVAAISRDVIFSDKRFSVGLFDESWALTSSPQGMKLIEEGLRDSRKHNAAIWLSTQDPSDITTKLGRHIGMRFVFRQGTKSGPLALNFLGLEQTEQWITLLESELGVGQCLYKDVSGRIGKIQVASAATKQLEKALNTTPSDTSEYVDDDYQKSTRSSVTS